MPIKLLDKNQIYRWQFWLLTFVVPCVYAGSILFVVYSNVWQSGLKGGGHGPADAYRHSLASALVAHTLSPKVVYLITKYMEPSHLKGVAHIMDRHNNLLGARIGASIPLSVHSIDTVNAQVSEAVNNAVVQATDPNQIRLLPKKNWVNNRYY